MLMVCPLFREEPRAKISKSLGLFVLMVALMGEEVAAPVTGRIAESNGDAVLAPEIP
jgi:glycine cleavage system H lipoate-binding protein